MWGYGPHWDMMGWGGGSWLGPFGMFLWLLFLILIIAAVVWFLRRNDRSGGERPPAVHRPSTCSRNATRAGRSSETSIYRRSAT
jgi:uncharacterized membrane protein